MLEMETVQHMEHPACSPDLNVIEYICATFKQHIAIRPMSYLIAWHIETAHLEESSKIS